MVYRHRSLVIPALLFAAAALTSCSRRKTIGRDELRSEIRSARSFAAESEMFAGYIREGRATRHFAGEHATYLEDEVTRSLRDLEQASPEPGAGAGVRECGIQLELLRRELSAIRESMKEADSHL